MTPIRPVPTPMCLRAHPMPTSTCSGRHVAGRLLFAGEHTQSARLGYADGAMTSGIREAKRLLGTPTVALGRFTDEV